MNGERTRQIRSRRWRGDLEIHRWWHRIFERYPRGYEVKYKYEQSGRNVA